MRIKRTDGVSRFLCTNRGGSGAGICDSRAALFLCRMSANRVVTAGVRAAVSTVHDPDDGVVFESAAALAADAESSGRNGAAGGNAISTRTAVGGSLPSSGRRTIGVADGI